MPHKKEILKVPSFLLLIGLAGFVFSKVSDGSRVLAVICVYLLIFLYIRIAKLSWSDIGLQPKHFKSGLLLALPFVAIIILISTVLFLVDPDMFRDVRYRQSLSELFFMVTLAIPFFTVLLEELVFRGTLLSLASKQVSRNLAVVVSSLAFGFWHTFSAGAFSPSNISLIPALPEFVITGAIITITFVAGLFFSWLRVKSDSLVAPIIVHWAFNCVGVIFVYLAWL